MAAKVSKEFREVWNPRLKIVNQKLKEYGFRLKVDYGDGRNDYGFKCYVIPFEGRAIAVADGMNPEHAASNILHAQSNNPRAQEIIQIYKQSNWVEQLNKCLDDAVEIMRRIDLENYRKTHGQGR